MNEPLELCWEFVNMQADSGNGKCLDCTYSRSLGGSAHECIADHPLDCHVFEALCIEIDGLGVDVKGQEPT